MKNYYLSLVVVISFSIFVTHSLISQEKTKKYAWQHDDSALINALPDKYENSFPLIEEEKIPIGYTELIKSKVNNWGPLAIPKKSKVTETERKKKNEVENFLKHHFVNASQNTFDRDAALQTLMNWHPSKFALMLDNSQLEPFIQNRLSKKDSKTLHALATFFDKAARKFAEKDNISLYELQAVDQLETKALEILAKINTLEHVNKIIKTSISEHLEWMKRYKPSLYADYLAMCITQTPIQLPRLGLIPEKVLRVLEPQIPIPVIAKQLLVEPQSITTLSVTSQERALDAAQTPATGSSISTTLTSVTQEDATKETAQEEVERLSRLYAKQFKTRQYSESLKTAWTVTKKAKTLSVEFQAAKDHIKKMSTKNDYNALFMMATFEKDNPDQAITYFMQAQAQRSGLICEHPKIESPQNTLCFLTGSPLLISFEETDFVTETRRFLDHLAKNNSKLPPPEGVAL